MSREMKLITYDDIVNFSNEIKMPYEPVFKISKDIDVTFEGECTINQELMKQLIAIPVGQPSKGVLSNGMSMSFSTPGPVLVPVRKHRKKRIAKKWAKKYGYRYEFRDVHFEEVSLVNNDDEIDVLGRTERRYRND